MTERDSQGAARDLGPDSGESQGGAPNPNGGKGSGTGPDTFLGHGGQSDNRYRGGGDGKDGDDNPNATTG
jgi:hypothetical protein